MKRLKITAFAALLLPLSGACADDFRDATITLGAPMLMQEVRVAPFPADGQAVPENPPALMWPDRFCRDRAVLDGVDGPAGPAAKHTQLHYKVRLARNKAFSSPAADATTPWAFYNIGRALEPGDWYWQYCAVVDGVQEPWTPVIRFTVTAATPVFARPPVEKLLENLPAGHPRVLVDRADWDGFIKRNASSQGRELYTGRACKILEKPIPSMGDIDLSRLDKDPRFENKVMRGAYVTREARKIVDATEADIDILTRAYLLTKDKRFARASLDRVLAMIGWKDDPNLMGDFNASTRLSTASMAYDSFHDLLTEAEKKSLLAEIEEDAGEFYEHYSGTLSNHIADNHVWQMTLRIFTFAAAAVYGELPEADLWARFAYGVWCARFPGLNRDGAWHNGDSYFAVNFRTLVEVPYFYSRVTGFDFFADPWYAGNAMYLIYNFPPFSKSGGNGSSHQNVWADGNRTGYADALARLTGNTYAADYVRRMLAGQPEIIKKDFPGKSGDLTWFRLQCPLPLPGGPGLDALPFARVFPQSGLAFFDSDWSDYRSNAMCSMRSSPYGSTSHALANQNALNTFYGGKPLFYSSGHHISFTDEYSVYAHRASRAHNTILVDGMGQKIGTEGYGWMPRSYTGKKIAYAVGDASNAYGQVASPLWLERGRLAGLEYTPGNGWGPNHLKKFRRHAVMLGDAGLMLFYDELEADTPVEFSYLLHTVAEPVSAEQPSPNRTVVRATNGGGVSEAYLFSPSQLTLSQTDRFFLPAVNWLRSDDKGNFKPYANHWHLAATSPREASYRFMTIISTHAADAPGIVPQRIADGVLRAGDWEIRANLAPGSKSYFEVENRKEGVHLVCDRCTTVTENGKQTVLKDEIPALEM